MSKLRTFQNKTLETIQEINRYFFDLEMVERVNIQPISMNTFIVSYGEDYHERTKHKCQFIESNDFSMTYAFLRAIASNLYFLDKFIKGNNLTKDKIHGLIQSNLQALINQKTYLIK
jgi:hypothetical protein